ncbi:hypothetical protein ACS8E9_19615 [Pseudomonas neustonica]|jgi:hypothetical protein|uniref:Secreted protein n=1 Tax=Pseudomonas neustonica TaxID=2487346 RepID=A0ABX9XCF7_9PSED|nr:MULTISPECIES: hypothetical protein [Pseudomonas]MBA6421845.1 hypothetical protein [Pseudomonas sp. 5Ae-yellow]ROZ80241.1 hypothetical protein EF099_18395 [Pseudomonas sp. SSM44]ROZ80265.1 hypothetical protein EF096_19910 [Pseudomonas neustonica]|tara:strand:+ start:278 stop:499 length:222 start_codon:yes stop_codon:yes gene_type:complete
MNFLKSIAISSTLLFFVGMASAEEGLDRSKRFHENAREKQTRLSEEEHSGHQKQEAVQARQDQRQDGLDQADN